MKPFRPVFHCGFPSISLQCYSTGKEKKLLNEIVSVKCGSMQMCVFGIDGRSYYESLFSKYFDSRLHNFKIYKIMMYGIYNSLSTFSFLPFN